MSPFPLESKPACTSTGIIQLIHDPSFVKLVQDSNLIVFVLALWLLINGLTALVKALR